MWEAAGDYKRLVPKYSAINSHSLDLPGNAIPIPQSHSELVKFPNGQDADYHYVLNHLKDFRTASVRVVKERFLMQPGNPQLLSTLRSLTFPEPRGTDTTRQSGQSNLGPFGRFDNALRRGPDHTDNMYSEEDTQSLDKFLIREAYKEERETNSNIQQLIRRTQKDSIRELGKLHKIPRVGVYSHSSTRGGYVIGELITTCLDLRNDSRVYVFVLTAPHSMRKRLFAGLQRSTGK